MKQINLIDSTESDVSYKLTTFPDGEPHIVLSELDRKTDYNVLCRIANPNDLFVLMQVGDILNRQAVDWDLDIFYLMSARMDRVIHFEEAYTLKLVADIINSIHPRTVVIFHSHSKKSLDLINNSVDMEQYYGAYYEILHNKNVVYCFPDAGAAERYNNEFNEYDTITLKKVRDLENNGFIKSIDVINSTVEDNDKVQQIMIVDDLCDAGGTFVLSAVKLHELYPNAKLSIFVRHLVNPKGLINLQKTFDHVYITNSYKNWAEDIENAGYTNVTCLDTTF